MKLKEVYHASSVQGLKEITPRKGTHKKEWIYATRDPIVAAIFLAHEGGDFTHASGIDQETGKPYLVERFKGAFDLVHENRKGSIYVLPGETFLEGQTSFGEEVVSPKALVPLAEIIVNDVKDHVLKLVGEGEIILKYYPERFPWIPADDEDLVEKAARWIKELGDDVLDTVEEYHPNLLPRVLEKLNR